MIALRFLRTAAIALTVNQLNLQQQSNGISVYVDNHLVGNASSINFSSGNGTVQVCSKSATQVSCTPDYNTAVLASKANIQRGDMSRCVSTNGTPQYRCGTCRQADGTFVLCTGGLNPVATPTVVAPGMELEFVPDVPCPAAQSCTLNVDNTGLFTIKANDGGSNGVAVSGNGHIVHRVAADMVGTSLVWRLLY